MTKPGWGRNLEELSSGSIMVCEAWSLSCTGCQVWKPRQKDVQNKIEKKKPLAHLTFNKCKIQIILSTTSMCFIQATYSAPLLCAFKTVTSIHQIHFHFHTTLTHGSKYALKARYGSRDKKKNPQLLIKHCCYSETSSVKIRILDFHWESFSLYEQHYLFFRI